MVYLSIYPEQTSSSRTNTMRSEICNRYYGFTPMDMAKYAQHYEKKLDGTKKYQRQLTIERDEHEMAAQFARKEKDEAKEAHHMHEVDRISIEIEWKLKICLDVSERLTDIYKTMASEDFQKELGDEKVEYDEHKAIQSKMVQEMTKGPVSGFETDEIMQGCDAFTEDVFDPETIVYVIAKSKAYPDRRCWWVLVRETGKVMLLKEENLLPKVI